MSNADGELLTSLHQLNHTGPVSVAANLSSFAFAAPLSESAHAPHVNLVVSIRCSITASHATNFMPWKRNKIQCTAFSQGYFRFPPRSFNDLLTQDLETYSRLSESGDAKIPSTDIIICKPMEKILVIAREIWWNRMA